MNTPEIMCMLLSKLPGNARDKWSRNILTTHRRHKREPDLSDFIHFVNDETVIVSDPIFSKEEVEQYMDKKINNRRSRLSSFAEKYNDKVHVEEKSADCTYCSEDHKMDRYNAFMN